MSKTALVTGGAKRIGSSICMALARKGYRVVVHYRNSEKEALETAERCLEAGAPQAWCIAADLTSPAARAELIPRAIELGGSLDLLINCASHFEYDNAMFFTPAAFDEHLQSNFVAPVELTLALFKHVSGLSRPSNAHVVTILDQKVTNLNPDYLSYTLSKLASHSSIRMLAQSCAPVLRVNAVAPGLTIESVGMKQADFEKAHKIAALGFSSTPQDVAEAVMLLEAARAVTGQTLFVDGGQHLVPRARDVAFEIQS